MRDSLPPAPSNKELVVQVCPNDKEQTELVLHMVADSVVADNRSFFLEGIAGTGKTFLS